MANIATQVASNVSQLLTAPAGNDFQLNAIAQSLSAVPPVAITSIFLGNTPADFFEQSLSIKYPIVSVYCEKLSNVLTEKFRTFSGTTQVAIEIRHSSDQIQNIQPVLENYVSAACQVLDSSRGDWGNGLFYAGGYEVNFSPLKRGGRHYSQSAKVIATVDVSL